MAILLRVLALWYIGTAAALPAVRVVTKDSMRVKRISAEVQVQASVEQVCCASLINCSVNPR